MQRIEQVRKQLDTYNIDGLLITSAPNRKYMTRFFGTAGVALVSKTAAIFITDFRYMDQAKEQVKGYDIVKHSGPIFKQVAAVVERLGLSRLGFEQTITYESYTTLSRYIQAASLVPIKGLVEQIRLIKDENEIETIAAAAKIADDAFHHITSFIRPGITELDVANELEFFMRKCGATSSSFDIIVASGKRSALPHGVASEKVIEKGDLVTMDYGALYKGYCSDITRTVAVDHIDDEKRQIYETVLTAQKKGVAGIKPNMTGKEVDALTRDYITEKGYGSYFGHSTGHGIGLEVHEGPTLSVRSETVLQPGMIVTIEPGIYISNVGGVRIEDDVLITKEGGKTLTHAPKELLILNN